MKKEAKYTIFKISKDRIKKKNNFLNNFFDC